MPEEVDKALEQAFGAVEAMRTAHVSNLQCSLAEGERERAAALERLS